MATCEMAFSAETCRVIEKFENQRLRVRRVRMSDYEMKELMQFVSNIALKYKQISEDINNNLKLNNKHKKSKIRKRFSITKKDCYVIDRIIDSNKLNIYPKIVRVRGKTSKRYDFYQIRKIARIFHVALTKGGSTAQRLLEVPDVHFAISKIRQDEFGDLKRFLEYKA